MRRKTLGLMLAAALCPAQHIQFGSLVNGSPVAKPAMDSAGNLILLTRNLAFGICCGMGSRLVLLLNRETVTVPGRTVAVAAVRFRMPMAARRVLHFSIEPSCTSANFAPSNFIYAGGSLL